MPEPRAITAAIWIASMMLSFTLWRVAKTSPMSGPGRLWAVASGLAGLGIALNASQNTLPFWLALLVGNLSMVGGMVMILIGIRQAAGLVTPPFVPIASLSLMLGVTLIWGVVYPSSSVRVMVYCALMTALAGASAWAVQKIKGSSLLAARVYLTIPLLLVAVALALRGLATSIWGAPAPSEPNLTNILTYIVGGAAFLALQTGFILLHQMLLAEEVRLSAEQDALTGLLNRRGLQEHLSLLTEPYGLLVIDVDHFKALNDKAGHAVGDACLVYLGQYLQRQLRQHDLAIRMGGEEFAVILSGVQASDALTIAQRIRSDIARHSQAQTGYGFTVSIGIAIKTSDESFDTLWSRADQALYRAKEQGRNRCEWAQATHTSS